LIPLTRSKLNNPTASARAPLALVDIDYCGLIHKGANTTGASEILIVDLWKRIIDPFGEIIGPINSSSH
jgi:hypothetical protein